MRIPGHSSAKADEDDPGSSVQPPTVTEVDVVDDARGTTFI
jgi:hypothetical protein